MDSSLKAPFPQTGLRAYFSQVAHESNDSNVGETVCNTKAEKYSKHQDEDMETLTLPTVAVRWNFDKLRNACHFGFLGCRA